MRSNRVELLRRILYCCSLLTASLVLTSCGVAAGGAGSTGSGGGGSTPTGPPAPPAVISNPADLAVAVGNKATFTAAASGSPAPTVQWEVSADGGTTFGNVSGATSTSMSFSTALTQNGNRYRAVFTNATGSATSATALLTVNAAAAAPPVITASPSNQTIGTGNFVNFNAAASGSPTPTVQWQISTDGGATFSNLAGATSTFLGFPATLAQNGNLYRAVFTNVAGSATSATALLTVTTAPPAITASPSNQTIGAGNFVNFNAAASGSPTPTVQWQVSTDGGATFSNLTGATSTFLGFSTTVAQNGNLYRALFTNTLGSATTGAALLTVGITPAITASPSSQSIAPGSPVTFTAAASGSPTPTVQWQVSTNGFAFSNLTGATSTTLIFSATADQNGNSYRAVFTNPVGSATTANAVLTVTSPPLVTANPTNQTNVAGIPVTFAAAASGTPAPTVQWQFSTNGGATFSNVSSATSTMLTFATTLTQNGNLYRALFTNSSGSATTATALLTVTASSTGTNLPPIADPSGAIQTFTTDPSGQVDTTSPFFQSLGTNGRSCSNCHQEGDAWTISAADVQARFNAATFDANGVASDPIFRTVDGSTCDQGVDLTTPAGRARAFTLLTSRGLIRIALPVPANAEFTVQSVSNQYGCSDTTTLSMYRRPLPIANLRFLSQVMWDGRESSALTGTQNITQQTNPADLLSDLAHQSVSATRIHAQGTSDPTPAQQQAIVNFEMQLSVAQAIDSIAGSLQANGATGGPSAIASQPFTIGVNDPLNTPPPFNQNVFTPFVPWVNFPTNTTDGSQKAAIARGEIFFNTRSFIVTGVAGLNDVFFNNGPALVTCSFCHNDPNLGNHSSSLPLDIGVAEPNSNFLLGSGYLPLITLRNNVSGATITTTDPGVALTTGKWADIGKIKIPILRGLAARAPYFHNGSAQSLQDVISFYFNRFGIPLFGTDESDLIAFLNSL